MNFELTTASGLRQAPRILTLWGHFQRELIFISWATMEIALLTPTSMALMPWTGFWSPAQVALWLLCLLLLAFNLIRLMSLLWLNAEIQRNILVAGFLALVFVTFPILLYQQGSIFDLSWLAGFFENLAGEGNQLWTRDLSLFLLMLLVWWRGIRLAGQNLSVHRAGLRLRIGGLLLAPLAIWSARRLAWDVTPYVLLFFFAGLTAVALARAEQNEKEWSGLSALMSPRWLLYIVAYSVVTVLSAATVAAFVSGDSSLAVARWLSPLRLAVNVGAASMFSTIIYLSGPFFAVFGIFLEWLANLFGNIFASILAEGYEVPEFGAALELIPDEAKEPTAPLFEGDKAIVLLLMLALVLVVALTMKRLFQQSPLAANLAGSTSIDDPRVSRRQVPAGRRLLERLGLLRRWRTATSIRRIYQEMSRAADASGYPRAMSETPFEYLVTLNQAWPNNTADCRLITQAYVQVRYGEIPETKAEYDLILASWERLKHTLPAPFVQVKEPSGA